VDDRAHTLAIVLQPFRKCGALEDVAARGMTLTTARALALRYAPANAASPCIMANGIAQIHDEKLRTHLVTNLYEECGCGDPARSHIALFERFMRAVDVDPTWVAHAPVTAETLDLIDTFMDVCRTGPDYAALAILHSFEDLFAPVNGLLALAAQKSGVVDAYAGEFFTLHATGDVIHADRMCTALLGAADTEAKWRESVQIAGRGASLVYALFDSIARTDDTHHTETVLPASPDASRALHA
jgi:pyrroloquinoline quinone (PQQ) biosynthesis protein C